MSRKKITISELNLSKIGGRFAYVRLRAGLKQDDFANKLGISKGNVSSIENHKYDPSYQPIVQIIKIFQINSDWLLTGEGEPYIKDRVGGADEVGELEDDPEVADLMEMTREIVKSDTEYAFSLTANIKSFHRAMSIEQKFLDHEARIAQIENMTKAPRPDRRVGQRRNPDNNQEYDGPERRAGNDRRVSGLGK